MVVQLVELELDLGWIGARKKSAFDEDLCSSFARWIVRFAELLFYPVERVAVW